MKKFVIFIYFGFFLTVFAIAQSTQLDLQEAAKVTLYKTEAISVKELRINVEQVEKRLGRPLNQTEKQALRLQILNTMINEKLIQQAADHDKISIENNDIENYIRQARAQLAQSSGRQNVSEADLALALGIEASALRTELRKLMLSEKYIMYKKEAQITKETAAIKAPTDAEISKFLADNQKSFMRPETVEISIIMVPFESNRTKAKETIDNLARKIGNSSDEFNKAMPEGILSGSAYRSGRLYLPRDEQGRARFGNEFVDTAFALRVGEISRVITGTDGFYIIRAETTFQPVLLGLNDPVQLGESMTVRQYISSGLLEQKKQSVLTKASEEAITELRTPKTGKSFEINEKNLNW